MYKVGHENDEPLLKEAYSAYKTKPSCKGEPPKTSNESKQSYQDDTTLPPLRPREVKDTPEQIEGFTTGTQQAPPLMKEKLLRLPKARSCPEGMSAIGVSVLSTKGFVGGLNNREMDLQLDSCADITLISLKFYETLISKPSIKQGMRMRLWQLTDKDLQLKGFVCIPIYMTTIEGDILETEAEAYFVPI